MKYEVKWTDLAEECFAEELMLGETDDARSARIKETVMKQIQNEESGRRSARKTIRLLPLVAILAVLFTVTAYAAGLFTIKLDPVESGQTVQGEWIERDEEGNVVFRQTLRYDDAGLLFTFDGDTPPHRIVFHPGWLPSEPDIEWKLEELDGDWYGYLGDTQSHDPTGADIPYVIQICHCDPYHTVVIPGDAEIVREGELAGYKLTEVHSAWNEHLTPQNYVLLLDETRGFVIAIVGSDSFEDLERIATELEIRELDEIVPFNPDNTISILAAGRG